MGRCSRYRRFRSSRYATRKPRLGKLKWPKCRSRKRYQLEWVETVIFGNIEHEMFCDKVAKLSPNVKTRHCWNNHRKSFDSILFYAGQYSFFHKIAQTWASCPYSRPNLYNLYELQSGRMDHLLYHLEIANDLI